jgi:hypothetical protein
MIGIWLKICDHVIRATCNKMAKMHEVRPDGRAFLGLLPSSFPLIRGKYSLIGGEFAISGSICSCSMNFAVYESTTGGI